MKLNKLLAGGVAVLSISGGALAVAALNPFTAASAQDTGSTTSTPSATTAPSAATSNEEATHEAGESADREAAEDSGHGHGGFGHGSNEDATHEAGESSAREAAEDAAKAPAPAASSTAG